MFVITVSDAELTTVRGMTDSIDVALHHRDRIVSEEYADFEHERIDGDPMRIAILGDGVNIAEVEIHTGVEVL